MFAIDTSARACSVDADCQVFGSCDCQRCMPSKRMDVGLCAEKPCAESPCAGRSARCEGSLCTTEGYSEAVARHVGAHLDDVVRVVQAALDTSAIAARVCPGAVVFAWEPKTPRPPWTCGGSRVVVADGLPASARYFLPQLSIGRDRAFVTFFTAPDGPAIQAELARGPAGWTVTSTDVTPRSP
jgi:hypothetical protein